MNTTTVDLNKRRSRSPGPRFGNLIDLGPKGIAGKLDEFNAGRFREAAYIFDLLEQRDDLLRSVISKRKKSVARHGWTILPVAGVDSSNSLEARSHIEALEFFYNNVECESALDAAEKGGFKLLARQMMDAVGKRFAVHEIIWRRATEGGGTNRNLVTATFRFVPLGFFENTTGELRFLGDEFATAGEPLAPGAWMVTAGDGLMLASTTAWVFKNIALVDWLRVCQRNGTPAIIGVTTSSPGTPERTAFDRALAELQEGMAISHAPADNIRLLDMLGGANLPFAELVERVDRLLAALWRGADLSTLSRNRGYGASLQEKETCALEEDDAEMITETLNRYVDAWVIRQVFGPEVKPLARIKVLVSPRECTTSDLQIDEFLLRHGAPLPLELTLNRYGRALPKPGEKVLLRGTKASLPENSQNWGWAEHTMGNQEARAGQAAPLAWSGPIVSSRGCSPASSPPAPAPLENQFTVLQEEWLQLSPYGDYPHARGVQRIDRAAAEAMVAQFDSFTGRAGRLFGGVPFYAGHPDLPGASELADRKAYGWVVELAAREDGLYGRVKWSDAGLDLLRNAHYRFLSPFWEAKEIAVEAGRRIYRPVTLLSVGLTNQPNIPVKPLANETTPLPAERDLSIPLVNTQPRTAGLALRRHELERLTARRFRIQECVLAQVRAGLSYDEAWEQVKREHRAWFED